MRIYGSEPRFQMISLAEDTLSGGDSGQVDTLSSDIGDTADTSIETPEEPSYFHTMKIPGENGEEEVLNFKDPKELTDRYLANRLRRADYTKKTQALSEKEREWQKKISDYEEREQMLTRTSNKYEKFNQLLGDLTPREMQELANSLSSRKKPDDPRYKELRTELDSIKQEREERLRQERLKQKEEQDREKYDSAHKYLKGFYSDYDPEAVMKYRDELMNADPSQAHQKLMETFYYASRGKATLRPPDPQGQPRTSVSGGKTSTPGTKKMSTAEARQAAAQALEHLEE